MQLVTQLDEPVRVDVPLLPTHKPAVFTALRTLAVASALVVGTLCVSIALPWRSTPSGIALPWGATTSRVLVTGFKPFGNISWNPAEEVALQLNGSCLAGVCIEGWSLSVDHGGAEEAARRVVDINQHWDAVLHLGFESVAKGLRIETMAANVLASDSRAWSAVCTCPPPSPLCTKLTRALAMAACAGRAVLQERYGLAGRAPRRTVPARHDSAARCARAAAPAPAARWWSRGFSVGAVEPRRWLLLCPPAIELQSAVLPQEGRSLPTLPCGPSAQSATRSITARYGRCAPT